MTKSRILQILAAVGAAATALGGLDLSGIIQLIPDPWATILAVGPPAVATIAHAISAALKDLPATSTFTRRQ